jgi:hypothetical protein
MCPGLCETINEYRILLQKRPIGDGLRERSSTRNAIGDRCEAVCMYVSSVTLLAAYLQPRIPKASKIRGLVRTEWDNVATCKPERKIC